MQQHLTKEYVESKYSLHDGQSIEPTKPETMLHHTT